MQKIAGRQVIVEAGEVSITAELLDTPTSHALLAALPAGANVSTWGNEIYFPLPLDCDLEAGARDVVEAGELAYWPAGGCIAIGFGPTPASHEDEIRLAAPVNIWARTRMDLRTLASVRAGEPVRIYLDSKD